jgi:lipopolysaccharide exporter
VLSSIYINLDQLMTAAFLTPASVAYYNAARRINGFIDVPTYAAAEIAFPKMSQASSNEGITKIKYLYEKIVALLLSLIIPIGLVVVLFPKLFILIIAGAKYLDAAPILQIYIVVSLIGTLQHQAGTTLYSIGKTRLCFFGNCFSLLVNFGATFFCLKFFGFYGAAFGALISSIITSVFWYSIMRREVGFEISNIPTYSRQYYQLAFTKVTGFLKARKSVG